MNTKNLTMPEIALLNKIKNFGGALTIPNGRSTLDVATALKYKGFISIRWGVNQLIIK